MHDVDTWSVNTRGDGRGDTGNLPLIAQASQALAGDDFEGAMDILGKVDTVSFDVSLLLAGAHFGLKAYPQAAEALQSAIQLAGSSLAKQEAEWKLAMVYVAMRDDAKAKALLQQIASNPDNDYAEVATQTLAKLNSIWRKLAW